MTTLCCRAPRAAGRRLAAMLLGVTLSTVVVVDQGLSRCFAALAGDVRLWLLEGGNAVARGLVALREEVVTGAPTLRGSLAAISAQRRGTSDDVLAFGAMRVPRRIAEDVLRAAIVTGVDPVYLMALADKESSFQPRVRAGTSSAVGLFQFVEGTWLQMLRDAGPRHGLGAEAGAITVVAGRLAIRDPAERERILALRNDPYLSAVMAAELLKRSEARITRELDRPLLRTEWYLAHFLGTSDALRFLRSRQERPRVVAAHLLPAAARANRALFTRPAGRRRAPVTLDELYGRIDRMMLERLDRYGEVMARARPEQLDQWY